MKKILLLILVVVAVLAYAYRQRLYLRDVIATVTADEVKQETRIYINASNDVLLETGGLIGTRTLVQHGNRAPGVPTGDVTCEWRLLCLLDADKASLAPVEGGPADAHVVMTSKVVTFRDENGRAMRVQLY